MAIAAGLAAGGEALGAEAVIVVVGPTKGFASERTAAMATAVAARIADINANGGVLGERLRLERTDDGCGTESAAAVASQLASLKPAAVLGHPCAGASVAAAGVYAKSGVLYLALASRYPPLTAPRIGPMIFRLSGREDRQGDAAGRYLAKHFPAGKIAIVHDGARINRTLADDVARSLTDLTPRRIAPGQTFERPLRLEIPTKRKDYSATALALKSADAIVFAGFPMEAGLLLKALRQSGSAAQFLITDTARTSLFTDTFAEGAIGVKAIAATGGAYPGVSDADWAVAALDIFAEAARRTGSLAPITLASVLQAQRFETPFGCLEFAGTGDAELCGATHPGTAAGEPLASGLERLATSGTGLVTAGYGVLSWNGRAWITSVESQASD